MKNVSFFALLLLLSLRGIACGGHFRNKIIFGIDIGTINTRVGIYEKGDVKIITSDATRKRFFPSVVAIDSQTGERLIGDAALNWSSPSPENAITQFKRFIGKNYDVRVQRKLFAIVL